MKKNLLLIFLLFSCNLDDNEEKHTAPIIKKNQDQLKHKIKSSSIDKSLTSQKKLNKTKIEKIFPKGIKDEIIINFIKEENLIQKSAYLDPKELKLSRKENNSIYVYEKDENGIFFNFIFKIVKDDVANFKNAILKGGSFQINNYINADVKLETNKAFEIVLNLSELKIAKIDTNCYYKFKKDEIEILNDFLKDYE